MADLVELTEHRTLEVEPLGDRLDDKLGLTEVGERRRRGDPAEQRRALLLGELAARHGPRGRVLEVLPGAGDRVVVDLHPGDVETGTGEHLRDARAHGAETDDADLAELASHARSTCTDR